MYASEFQGPRGLRFTAWQASEKLFTRAVVTTRNIVAHRRGSTRSPGVGAMQMRRGSVAARDCCAPEPAAAAVTKLHTSGSGASLAGRHPQINNDSLRGSKELSKHRR